MAKGLREAPVLDEGLVGKLKALSLDEQRVVIGVFLRTPSASALWDLMCGLRGPDSPSERGDLSSEVNARNYKGRRDRKFKTAEIVRQAAFFGVTGGCARHHKDEVITLPPENKWDHFDHHQDRAARVVGLEVKIEAEPSDPAGVKICPPGPMFDDVVKQAQWEALLPHVRKAVKAYASLQDDQWKVYLDGYWKGHHPKNTNVTGCCPTCKAIYFFCPPALMAEAKKRWGWE